MREFGYNSSQNKILETQIETTLQAVRIPPISTKDIYLNNLVELRMSNLHKEITSTQVI